MMKIGVSVDPYGKAANLYGEEMFQKLRSFGFSAIDYNITCTKYELYTMDDESFTQRLSKEKAAADAAGIAIHQMHGHWRSPPRDATPEDRQERMEKMQRSILAAHLLGCKYWVIHPIMPYGALDLDTEDPPKGIIDWPGFMKALKEIGYDGVFSLETAPDKNLEGDAYAEAFTQLCQLAKQVTQLA